MCVSINEEDINLLLPSSHTYRVDAVVVDVFLTFGFGVDVRTLIPVLTRCQIGGDCVEGAGEWQLTCAIPIDIHGHNRYSSSSSWFSFYVTTVRVSLNNWPSRSFFIARE